MCSSWGLSLLNLLHLVAQARLRRNFPALLLLYPQWVGQSLWLAWGQTLRMSRGKMFCCVSRVTSRPVQHPAHKACWIFSVGLFLLRSWLHVCNRSNHSPACLRRLLPPWLILVRVHCSSVAQPLKLLLTQSWRSGCRRLLRHNNVHKNSKLRKHSGPPKRRQSSSNNLIDYRTRIEFRSSWI